MLGQKLQDALEGATPFLGPSGGQSPPRLTRRPLVLAGIVALLLAMAYAIRLYARRPMTP